MEIIDELAPFKRSTMALFFTHWRMYREKNAGRVLEDDLDAATIDDVIWYWIGAKTPHDCHENLERVMLSIDMDYWNQFLRCR